MSASADQTPAAVARKPSRAQLLQGAFRWRSARRCRLTSYIRSKSFFAIFGLDLDVLAALLALGALGAEGVLAALAALGVLGVVFSTAALKACIDGGASLETKLMSACVARLTDAFLFASAFFMRSRHLSFSFAILNASSADVLSLTERGSQGVRWRMKAVTASQWHKILLGKMNLGVFRIRQHLV